MPLITLPADPAHGPIIVLGIAAPRSLIPGTPAPSQAGARFLIDTGATRSAISPALAAAQNLPVLGKVAVTSVTHAASCNEYLADVLFPIGSSGVLVSDARLLEFAMAGANYDGLLGRDFLHSGLFQLNASARQFTLAF